MKSLIDIRGKNVVYISKTIASAQDNDMHVYNMNMMIDFIIIMTKKTFLIIKTECNWLSIFTDRKISENHQIALK